MESFDKSEALMHKSYFYKNLICIRGISRRPFVRDCQFYKIIITKVKCKNMHFVGLCHRLFITSFHLDLYKDILLTAFRLEYNVTIVLCEPFGLEVSCLEPINWELFTSDGKENKCQPQEL